MAEIFALTNVGRYDARRMRCHCLLLSIGDRIQITSRCSMTVEQRDGRLEQVWISAAGEHAGPIEQAAEVRLGGVCRIVCRAVSGRRALLEFQMDTLARDKRVPVIRAHA